MLNFGKTGQSFAEIGLLQYYNAGAVPVELLNVGEMFVVRLWLLRSWLFHSRLKTVSTRVDRRSRLDTISPAVALPSRRYASFEGSDGRRCEITHT